MNGQQQRSGRQTERTPVSRQVPEFYMPAMPPLALTEAMDRWYRRWVLRRQFRRFLKLSDGDLATLGLKRETLAWAARQPLATDAFEALRGRNAGSDVNQRGC